MGQDIDKLTKEIALEPGNAKLYSTRAISYWLNQDHENARKDYAKAIELDPENGTSLFYFLLNNHWLNINKDSGSAVKDYTKAIELIDPENADLYSRRAFFYLLQGNSNAIKDYTKAIELEPKNAEFYSDRGRCHTYFEKYDNAIEDFTKAIELYHGEIYDSSKAYSYRGECYLKIGKYDEALNDCNKAIELDDKCIKAYEGRGDLYCKMNDYEKAEADYKQTYEDLPSAEICDKLKDLYLKTNEFEAASSMASILFHDYGDVNSLFELEYITGWAQDDIRTKEQEAAQAKIEHEQELNQLRTSILQAISHTISNIMLANKSITKRIKRGTSSMNDVNRLELLNDLVLSTMKAVKLAFSKEDIVVSKTPDDLSLEKIRHGISLHDLLFFCLNINLHYLVSGEGEEGGWETMREIFFLIDEDDEDDMAEKGRLFDEMKRSPGFSISELSEESVLDFVKELQTDKFHLIHRFFTFRLDALKSLYVKRDSYTFAVLFIIFLELTKNMLRYGTVEDENARKFVMACIDEDDSLVLTMTNVCERSGLNLKQSTLQGLAMIQEFSKVVGKFEKTEKDIDDSDFFEFTTKLFIKKPVTPAQEC